MQVVWKYFYKKGDSYSEACTLPQLKSLINRSNVPSNPKNNVNAADDFIEVCSLLFGYVSSSYNIITDHPKRPCSSGTYDSPQDEEN